MKKCRLLVESFNSLLLSLIGELHCIHYFNYFLYENSTARSLLNEDVKLLLCNQ
jgi:hypothetical protein